MALMPPAKAKRTRKQRSNPSQATWSTDWEVAVRVWIERRGQTVLADGLADLMVAIQQTNSISAAARKIGISYRHAWTLVSDGNAAAGDPLVTAAVGGLHGGGAQLTERGKLSLEVFDQLRGKVRETAASLLQTTLTPAVDLSASLHLAAAISLQEAIGQLLTEYALRLPNVRVRTVFGASNELADHVLAGAPCDLFVSADPLHLDRLAAEKRLRGKSRRVVAVNGLAVVGPEGATPLSSPAGLLKLTRVALADPQSPLGKCSQAYLRHAGIDEALAPKMVMVDNSRAILAAIRSGRADAGLAFASDAAKAAGCCTLLAIEPAAASLVYTAAICAGRRESDAQALLDFFQSPAAVRCFRRCGLSLPRKSRTKG